MHIIRKCQPRKHAGMAGTERAWTAIPTYSHRRQNAAHPRKDAPRCHDLVTSLNRSYLALGDEYHCRVRNRTKDLAFALMIIGVLWFAGVVWAIGGYDEGGLPETILMSMGGIPFVVGVCLLLPADDESSD